MRKLLADALRAFAALPDDDWRPHDWYVAMEAKRLAGEELALLDRAATSALVDRHRREYEHLLLLARRGELEAVQS